jgi:hypothetical protein
VAKFLTKESNIWTDGVVPAWANKITIHNLLTHRSGLTEYFMGTKLDITKPHSEINKDIAETIAQINSLMAALAALGAMTGLGGGGGGGGGGSSTTRDLSSDYARFKAKERADEAAAKYIITNNVTSNVSAQEIADATQRAIKFGQTVTVGKDR